MPQGTTGPLPFILAVTGHRDLHEADVPVLSSKVRALLTEIRDACPHTRIELLTPLAEGADRVAAKAAQDLGIPFIAVLPMEPAEYKKDFTDDRARLEFDALLAAAAGSIVLPAPAASALRPEAYVGVAAYIVQHAHVLMALWDGVHLNKRGGTSEVVRACLEGPDPKYARASRMLDPQETGLVYHIVASRNGTPLPNAGETRWLMPGGGSEKTARAALAQLTKSTDDFNRRAASHSGKPLFEIADALAMQSQRAARIAIASTFALGFGAIVAFEAVTEDVSEAKYPFVVLFVLAYAMFWWVSSRGFADKHLDYRSLAEALRVQGYWRLAGITNSIAPNYMRYHLKESEWIRKALLAGDLHDDISGASAAAAPSGGLETAITDWLHGQNGFFERAEARGQRQLESIGVVAKTLGGFSLAGVMLFMVRLGSGEQHALALTIAVLAGGAGALQGYAEKRALDAQTKRYARMRGIFQSAIRILKQSDGGPEHARDVLRELGKEALEENADWVMLHRDRPLGPPKGPGA